jgi:hypothetical protein
MPLGSFSVADDAAELSVDGLAGLFSFTIVEVEDERLKVLAKGAK